MAKGWSFGALTDALKSSAFVETTAAAGDGLGNAMTVGFSGIGRTNIPVLASLNMATYRWHLGESIYVKFGTISGPDPASFAKLKFVPADAIRISCVAVADSVYTLLFTNSNLFYFVNVDANQSTFVFEVRQMIVGTTTDTLNILQPSMYLGNNSAGYATLFLVNPNGQRGYVQLDNAAGDLYLCSGGTGRATVKQDGTIFSTGRFVGQQGISEFWAVSGSQAMFNAGPGSRIPMNQQGLHLGWNEAAGSGAASFVNNQGGGGGGFRFRNINAPNTVETANWQMNGADGVFYASGDLVSGPSKRVYANNRGSWLDVDGNVYGSVWGGYLSNWINTALASRDAQINIRATYDWVNATFAPKNQLYASTNGWFKDTSTGLIIQWGFRQSQGTGTEAAGFNISFPNASLAVVATLGTTIGPGGTVYTSNANTQGFNYKTSGAAFGFTFIAIGY